MDFFPFLEGNVEVARVENLAQFDLDCAQDFVLIQVGADRLPDLCQQLIFLGATLRVVHDHVIFKRQTYLQRQPDQQPEVG